MDREIENLADYYAEDTGHDLPDALNNLFWDAADYSNFRLEYSRAYAEAFCAEYFNSDDCTFSGMESPRFYNFETDRVFVKVPTSVIRRIYAETPNTTITRYAEERHTSYDGFISHYSPDWVSWGPVETWDHNQLQTLLLAYLYEERGEGWDQWAEFSLIEDLSGNGYYDQWLWTDEKANRAWGIYDHLRERAQRPIKTLEAWARQNVKAWDQTPLGSL